MQSKSLLIAIAAFAVTATGVQAYAGNINSLPSGQRAAFAEAIELKEKGELEKARDVLIKAGVDEETINTLRKANKESRQAIKSAVEANNYEDFKRAAANSPLIDIITTESEFQLFVQAHQFKSEGNLREAKEILVDLGLPLRSQIHLANNVKKQHREFISELSSTQKEALRVAKEANDKETVRAILKEAGVTDFPHGKYRKE